MTGSSPSGLSSGRGQAPNMVGLPVGGRKKKTETGRIGDRESDSAVALASSERVGSRTHWVHVERS